MRWSKNIVLMFVLLALVGSVIAQRADGTLRGTVMDSSGAVVANAKVTATNGATGVASTTKTTSAGSYTIPNLQIGTYTVTIEAPSFAKHERKDVRVLSAQVVEVSPRLRASGSAETVEIMSGAEVVQTETSQLSASFSDRAVTDIPTTFAGGGVGSVQNLAVYVPNTTTQLGGTSGNGGSVGGLRGRQNSFSVDGASNNDSQVSVSAVEVIQDAVAEFTISTNQFSAEYGSAAGGQFNVVTKTGSNSLHGGAYWYTNNRHLNATSNQEAAEIESGGRTEKRRFDYNRLGGSLGGPIIADRLFFFGAYELQATGFEGSAPEASVPTAAGQAALAGMNLAPEVASLLSQWPVAPSGDVGVVTVTDPVTAAPVDIPVGTVFASAPSYLNQHDWIVNLDYNQGPHQFRFRHIKNRVRQPSLGDFPQSQFNASSASDSRYMIFNHIWTANTRFVNDFKASFRRLVSQNQLSATALAFPTLIVADSEVNVTVGPAGALPQDRTTNNYQLSDKISFVMGAHSFKAGVDYNWQTGPSNFLQNLRGQLGYASFNTFVNDLLPDLAGFNLQGIGSPTFIQNKKDVGWFIQDDWKINPRLTINLGLRYDFFGLFKGAAANGLNSVSDCPTCGTDGLFWHKPNDDFNNFAPRVGFAWDPTGSGKWSIRGGAGMGYDQIPGNFYTNGAPPQFQAVLNPATACTGTFGAPPPWCITLTDFLAGGAMHLNFVPPSTPAAARGVTGNLMADNISPTVYSWSLGVQRELMKDTSIELRYLGTRALHLPVQTQLNAITAFENGGLALPTFFSMSEVPATVALTDPNLTQFLNARTQRFASDGFFGVITNYRDIGNSRYHGASAEVHRRMSKGLLLRGNFTWAKTQDNATNDLFTSRVNPRRAENGFDIDREWGRSALDIRHKGTITWVYDIPKMPLAGLGNTLLNGWQWNGSYLYQSGQPITVQSGVDSNGNLDAAGDRAILNSNGSGRTGTAVNRVCRDSTTGATSITANSTTGCANANTVGYVAIDPNARFIQAGVGAVTDVGRNTVDTAPFNVWNMGFFKNTKIRERVTMQFRADMFNVFNHPVFALGSTSIFGSTGNATSTSYADVRQSDFLNDKQFDGGGRVIQLGLKLTF